MAPIALTIAGSDPSGGAGIQADLKTFYRFGVGGASVISLITAQNRMGIQAIQIVDQPIFCKQLTSVLSDLTPGAAKVGALGSLELVNALVAQAKHFKFPLVVDPILVGTQGTSLLQPRAIDALKQDLLPQTYLVTPNISEAEVLANIKISSQASVRKAATKIAALGVQNVLIKGGHGSGEFAIDMLYDGETTHEFSSPRIETTNTHGSGCAYSAAITAMLAKGETLIASIKQAKEYVYKAIESHRNMGNDYGPINHQVSCESH